MGKLGLLRVLVLLHTASMSMAATTPPGWRIESENGIQIYRTDDNMVEMRISAHRLLQPTTAETILAGLVHADRVFFSSTGTGTYDSDNEKRRTAYFYAWSYRGGTTQLEVTVEENKPVLVVYMVFRRMSQQVLKEIREIISATSATAIADPVQRAGSMRLTSIFRLSKASVLGSLLCDKWTSLCSGAGLSFSSVQGLGRKRRDVWLMLRDGTAYRNPEIAPEDFDVSRSRAEEPERWVQWRDNPLFEDVLPLPGVPPEHAHSIAGKFSVSAPLHMVDRQPALLEPVPDLDQYFAPTIPIEFKPDGTFQSLIIEREGAASVPKVSGKHIVRGYTLELLYDDGVPGTVYLIHKVYRNSPIRSVN